VHKIYREVSLFTEQKRADLGIFIRNMKVLKKRIYHETLKHAGMGSFLWRNKKNIDLENFSDTTTLSQPLRRHRGWQII
jgi:hypothetical protein